MDPDFELRWPAWLFVEEARRLLGSDDELGSLRIGDAFSWTTSGAMLLEEAFTSTVPYELFNRRVIPSVFGGPDDMMPTRYLALLAERAGEFPEAAKPRPYWSQRRNPEREAGPVSIDAVKTKFVELVVELDDRGYLAQHWPRSCVDDHDGVTVNRSVALEHLTGIPGLWPLRSRTWSDDTFFDLIEIFHDIVSRPTGRYFHDYGGCGYHWSGFVTGIARKLYKWRVNSLLAAAAIPFELALSGEDEGRLVSATHDARTELMAVMVERADPSTRDVVRHAIALFRGRAAGIHEKRSALVALAGVLEERRSTLKEELLTKDEAALFLIANQFGIRHHNASQHVGYDMAFLDWVFWWYLATVELSDRLIARQHGGVDFPKSMTES